GIPATVGCPRLRADPRRPHRLRRGLTPTLRGADRPDAIGRSTPAGRGGASGRSVRRRHGTGRAVVTLPVEQPWVPVEFGTHAIVLVGPRGSCRLRAPFTSRRLAEG